MFPREIQQKATVRLYSYFNELADTYINSESTQLILSSLLHRIQILLPRRPSLQRVSFQMIHTMHLQDLPFHR